MSGNVFKNLSSMIENAEIYSHSNKANDIKKIRYIDKKSKCQLMRHDLEKSIESLNFKEIDTSINYDVIVISDYNKGLIDPNLVLKIKESTNKKIKIFVDTKKSNLSCFSWDERRTVVKINEKESQKAENAHLCDIIITLGSEGCEYQQKKYKTNKVEVSDVCGAGDVFLAALVARWLETKDMNASIKTANNCASLSVTKLGCYTVTRSEYESLRV
jgi:D-beta-D-heptose 7-phosphate kinase/D-beta-D-heptose 1-phosphate adenosyltransferase